MLRQCRLPLVDQVPGAVLDVIGVDVLARHPERHGGVGHRPRHRRPDAQVEDARHDALVAQLLVGHQPGDGVGRRDQHLVVDARGARVHDAPQHAGKSEGDVQAMTVVGASRQDHGGPRGPRLVGADLRLGGRQGEDDRSLRHRPDHLRPHGARRRQPDEQIGALERVGDRPRMLPRVQLPGGRLLEAIHVLGAALPDDAVPIAQSDLLHSGLAQEACDGDAGSAGARDHGADAADLLADQLQGVAQRRQHRRAGALHVIEEERHGKVRLAHRVEDFHQLERARRSDVLDGDTAERRIEALDEPGETPWIALADAHGKGIDAGQRLEQDTLPLHHRHRRQRPRVAERQDRRAVRHHRHGVAAHGVDERRLGIVADRQARLGDAGGVDQAQDVLVADRDLALDSEKAAAAPVVLPDLRRVDAVAGRLRHRRASSARARWNTRFSSWIFRSTAFNKRPGRGFSCAGAKFSTALMPARPTRSRTFCAATAGTARTAMLAFSRLTSCGSVLRWETGRTRLIWAQPWCSHAGLA